MCAEPHASFKLFRGSNSSIFGELYSALLGGKGHRLFSIGGVVDLGKNSI